MKIDVKKSGGNYSSVNTFPPKQTPFLSDSSVLFAHLRIWVVQAPKKSRKNYRRHHLKKMFLSVLLRNCVFVFELKKSQPQEYWVVVKIGLNGLDPI
jgi:hypothetical protein